LYYTDRQGRSLPVNYRVVDKAEHKTKNVGLTQKCLFGR
jgi:hypothetical protein